MRIFPKLRISATFGNINLSVLLKMIDKPWLVLLWWGGFFFLYAPYFTVMMPLEELITYPWDCSHINHKCQAMQCFFSKQSRSVAFRVVSPNVSLGKLFQVLRYYI